MRTSIVGYLKPREEATKGVHPFDFPHCMGVLEEWPLCGVCVSVGSWKQSLPRDECEELGATLCWFCSAVGNRRSQWILKVG